MRGGFQDFILFLVLFSIVVYRTNAFQVYFSTFQFFLVVVAVVQDFGEGIEIVSEFKDIVYQWVIIYFIIWYLWGRMKNDKVRRRVVMEGDKVVIMRGIGEWSVVVQEGEEWGVIWQGGREKFSDYIGKRG